MMYAQMISHDMLRDAQCALPPSCMAESLMSSVTIAEVCVCVRLQCR